MTDMNSGSSNHSTSEIQHLYRERFGARSAYRNRVWCALIKGYFERYIRPTDTVLDLGAGYGEFINHIICARKYAMDLNPDTAEHVHSDVTLLSQDCSTIWPLPDRSLDIVFTSNFFEHLPDTEALTRTLTEANRCLKDGGRLIALGPNITYCGDAYWEVPDHRLSLSEKTLAEEMTRAGLRIEQRIDKFLPFTMSEGLEYPSFFVTAYLQVPLLWRIFGKQFLVIGRKGSA